MTELSPGAVVRIQPPTGLVQNLVLREGPEGPQGAPGGSDAATADWVENGPLTTVAVNERVAANRAIPRNVRDYGAVGDGTTDDTAAFQAAIDAVSANGGKVIVPADDGGTTYRLDSTVVIKRRVEVEVAGGAICKRVTAAASTAPVFRLAGNEAALTGNGRVETEKASPNGVVLIGPETITSPLINTLSARVSNIVIKGVKAAGNVGLRLWSSFVANGGATYQNIVRDVTLDFLGTGILISDVANANEFHGIQWKNILDYCVDFNANTAFRGADENAVIGGFVHASANVTCFIFRNCVYNVVMGTRLEPGGTAVAANFDATSLENYVQVMDNLSGAPVDLGTRNTLVAKARYTGQRLIGNDGLATKAKAGAVVDGDFAYAPISGLMALDTSNNRLYNRVGATWKYAKVRTRHFTVQGVRDFPSIAAGATAEMTVGVPGVVVGDSVLITPNGAPEAGLMWTGYVSATDVVTIRLANVTAGAIDPASRTWMIDTFSQT